MTSYFGGFTSSHFARWTPAGPDNGPAGRRQHQWPDPMSKGTPPNHLRRQYALASRTATGGTCSRARRNGKQSVGSEKRSRPANRLLAPSRSGPQRSGAGARPTSPPRSARPRRQRRRGSRSSRSSSKSAGTPAALASAAPMGAARRRARPPSSARSRNSAGASSTPATSSWSPAKPAPLGSS